MEGLVPYYIANDCETGGFAGTSLLTAFFAVMDEDFKVIDTLDLRMKPDDGIYKVTAEALRINGINLIEHEKTAITYKEAGTKLYEFIKKYSSNGKVKLVPLGQNVGFDVKRYLEDLIGEKTWHVFVSYRLADTGSTLQYLKDKKVAPKSIAGSLGSLCKWLGIPYEKGHTADGDTYLAAECYKRMLKL